MPSKLLIVLGTRPEAIKLGPLIEKARRDPRFEVQVCSTGQHREMLLPVFDFFEIRPDVDFQIMKPGQALADVTSSILLGLRNWVRDNRPDWIIVQGDTTTTMAASLCAMYERIPVAHVEAGLRTGDIDSPFPEEFNRRVTTLVSKVHFPPTPAAAANLLREAVEEERIHITGNTGIDALLSASQRLASNPMVRAEHERKFAFLNPAKKLVLVTVHRRESFGEPMRNIMKGLLELAKRPDIEMIIPLHLNPEVRRAAEEVLGLNARWASEGPVQAENKIWLTEPQAYTDFVYLMNRCHFIITDSGGVQEEAPSLGKPVLVVRESTERPEAIEAGTSRLIGASTERVIAEATRLLDSPGAYEQMAQAKNPFGDGRACERILECLAPAEAEEVVRESLWKRVMNTSVASIAASALSLLLCFTAQAQTLKVLPPESGAYQGAFADFGGAEQDVSLGKIREFEALSGKKLAWAYFGNHWWEGKLEFPKANVDVCKVAGVIPYIRFSPWSDMTQLRADRLISMQGIIDGNFDAGLREWARAARDSGTAIMMEFGPEVNGRWFPWNGKWNGGSRKDKYGDPSWPDGPERFRDAYRHVVDLFREEGALNITWILHVDANWSPEESWNEMRYYYPGDEYIDWIGVSVFGRQLPQYSWFLFPQVLKPFLRQIEEAAPTKPMLVSEFAVIEDKHDPERKGKWLKQALQSVSKGLFKKIKGVTYWNSPGWLAHDKANFKIDSSEESTKAYREEMAQPFWLEDVVLSGN